jgi:hypothetical protein
MDTCEWVRVWWWNGGAHTMNVPADMAPDIVEGLKADGFYCWTCPGVPVTWIADPPPGS